MSNHRSLTHSSLPGVALTLVLVATSALAEDAATRLKKEQQQLREQLLKWCQAQRERVNQLEASPALRLELFEKLDSCGGQFEPFLIQYGNTLNTTEHFKDAESVFRRALKLRVTEAGQIGLLTALVRQPSLTPTQKADL